MKGLSTMFQQLPEEVLEDQIPLTGPLILEALNSKATDVRQAGIMVLVAAHRVIRDEQRLFNMFKTESGDGVLSDIDDTGESLGRSGLTDQQMALATYYFSKDDNNPLQ